MRKLLRIASRSLLRQGRRNQLLGAAIAFSFFVIVVIASVLGGMVSSLEEKAKIYYGGDITIRGVEEGWNRVVRDAPAIAASARRILGTGPVISERYEHRDTSTTLYFGGESIRQRILIGIDFSVEAELFSRFNYVEGGSDGIKGSNGILISEPIARILKAKAGDDLLLLLPTLSGQKNTATVVVRGIFRDSSLFGYYTSYLDIDFLRGLVGAPDGYCTNMAIFFPAGRPARSTFTALQRGLEREFAFFPLYDKQQAFWDAAAAERAPGAKYALLGLDANLEQVRQLLDAVYAVSFVLIAMLLGIVVLGVSGAYRVIVHERTREIGTMRALGMQAPAVAFLLMAEAGLLAGLGSLTGGLAAWGALRLLLLIDFSFIPFFDIFLRGGRLAAPPSLGTCAALAGLLVATALAAVAGPARRAARIEPSEAMRSES